MKADRIKVGMILKLKPEVRDNSVHVDGSPIESDLVTVTAIKFREGYSIPWIMSGIDAFKPSDFLRLVDYAL